MFDSGEIYHAISFTVDQAHRFLCELPIYERSGLVVRVPDFWQTRRPPRPRVTVTVGGKPPARLGMEALLDFDVKVTIGGVKMTRREIAKILASTEGLQFIKGRWVEVNREELEATLERWKTIQEEARLRGIGFGEAMRLLSGVGLGEAEGADAAVPDWSEVVAGKWLSGKLEALRSPALLREISDDAGLRASLRPYQKEGVQWLLALRGLELGGCLADDMGLGKTIQVLAVLNIGRRSKDKGTDLLVVPASVLDNWRNEIDRFAPSLKVLMAHPSHLPAPKLKTLPRKRVEAMDAVITTYGTVMRTDWMKRYSWRSVILDEAQAIKNPGAKQTKAVKALSSRWRIALTGTPVENRLGDLWSIFDFLNAGLLGSPSEFNRLCKSMAATGHYGPLRRLVAPYILRRLKTDKSIISDLPEKTEVRAYCLLTKRQAALYQASVDELKETLRALDGIERRGKVLSYLMRFKQICNHPSQWLGDGGYDPQESGKAARLREIVESIASRQEKALVFTQFRQMTGALASWLRDLFGQPGIVLHGGTPVRKRQGLVKRFQEDDAVPFMVISLKAGGTGLNLTRASHVIHFDRWWNPAVENQATDRAFRIGQRKNVLVHKLVCRGTVEERIDKMMETKEQLSKAVLGASHETALTEMSDEELLAMVRLDIRSAVDG